MAEEQKRQQEIAKEEKRRHVTEHNKELVQTRIGGYLDKLNQADAKVASSRSQAHQEMLFKRNLQIMKTIDREENKQRVQEMREYQREHLKDKIRRDDERTMMLKHEKDKMIAMRQNLRRKMDQDKEHMMQEFYRQQQIGPMSQTDGFRRGGEQVPIKFILTLDS